jgi:hypothetical protein
MWKLRLEEGKVATQGHKALTVSLVASYMAKPRVGSDKAAW